MFQQQKSLPLTKPMHAYGGDLRKKAKNRGARTLVCKSGSMHFTLRSTKATGLHSFQNSKNRGRVKEFVRSFSAKKGVQILSFANVGNHLHLHVKIHSQRLYKEWIRGLSSGLAMIAMGLGGLKKLKQKNEKFWNQRPFSRVIQSFRHFLNTKSYLEINALEGLGMPRAQAELIVKGSRHFFRSSS
jgi:REP element-mobilizing transposase RayT